MQSELVRRNGSSEPNSHEQQSKPWPPLGRRGHAVTDPCRSHRTETVPRILVLSSGLGPGHARAAQAIEAALLEEAWRPQVRVLDWWSLMDSRVAVGAQAMYLQLVQEYPDLY